jgi:hypothetical protein
MAAGLGSASAAVHYIVLLGDSVFDNAAYVAGGPDVVGQVNGLLPAGWRAALQARDGAVIRDVRQQMLKLTSGAGHLIVSAGGNDALAEASLLNQAVTSVAEALELMTRVRERFQSAYVSMLDELLGRGLPLAVCTIYDPRFPDPLQRRVAATALTAINDIITREAFSRSIDVLDLRVICNRDEDFANAIEPSVRGGAKIARAIADFALSRGGPRSRVIAG